MQFVGYSQVNGIDFSMNTSMILKSVCKEMKLIHLNYQDDIEIHAKNDTP